MDRIESIIEGNEFKERPQEKEASIEEYERLVVTRAERLRGMIRTEGFRDLYQYIKETQGVLGSKVFDVDADSVEGIYFKREELVHKWKALKGLLTWLERQLEEAETIKGEWAKRENEGGDDTSSSSE